MEAQNYHLIYLLTRVVMGDFKNGLITKSITTFLGISIIAVNFYFLSDYVYTELPRAWYSIVGVIIFFTLYVSFIIYLSVYLLICLGFEGLIKKKWVQKWYWTEPFINSG